MEETQTKKIDNEENKNLNIEPVVINIPLESLDFELIEKISDKKNDYLQIFRIDIICEEEIKIIFNKKENLLFEVYCATSKLLIDLKAEYILNLIVFDQETGNPQLFYSQIYQGKLKHQYFKISFNSKANIKGIFRPRAILQLRASGLFNIYDGCFFRVL